MKRLLPVAMAAVLVFGPTLASHAASSTFYLSLKEKSCYSFTKTGASTFPIDSNAKNMFAVACNKPHHFEVIKAGQVPSAGATLTQEDMSAYCTAAYRKKFGMEAPSEIKSGAVYLRWYFPDAGLETKKYKNQGICIVHKSDSKYSVFSVLKTKL